MYSYFGEWHNVGTTAKCVHSVQKPLNMLLKHFRIPITKYPYVNIKYNSTKRDPCYVCDVYTI